ncbi:CCAAT-binding transcription factor, subunit B [Corchorus capsularis]|uniref:CCAAT-binding transcription factor, subunit B n=1 Tax=Corchorus capsularis TaxID=210143 RepID=A0A1R3JWN8_COCAP|nr:CCAAT-binding transcription factor, subunit B [Corchorus capsularis]
MELLPLVGELANLQELDLDQTQIMFLPREIGKLLAFYTFASIVLSNMRIDVDPADKRWDESVEIVGKFTVGLIKRRLISRVPQEGEAEFRNWDKCLKFVNGENIPIEIKGVLKYSNSFFLDRHATAKNLSEFGMENMKRLNYCLLAECNKMETIIDEGNNDINDQSETHDPNSTENVVLQSLEHLRIYYMENLGSIWKWPTRYGCMCNLKFLAMHSCPQLSNVLCPALLENLVNLEELILEDCPRVTSLVSHPSVKPIILPNKFLPSLKRLMLLYLPELVSISNGLPIAPKLESIGFYNCPNLKSISKMELSSKTLKMIKGELWWWEDMKWNETEWGNRPDYLMHIFSPINNKEDVMTQMAGDRVLHELDYMEERINGTNLKQSTPCWTSQLMGSHQRAEVPLPSSAIDDRACVNAKQYLEVLSHGQACAEFQLQNKLVKKRKPLLHKSRHLHEMNRATGSAGRFLMNKKENENEQNDAASGDKSEFDISKNLAKNDLASPSSSSGDKSQSNITSNSAINEPALDLSTTASTPWSSRVMHSPDLAQGCDVTSESERSFKDNVMRHHMQIEMNNSCGSVSKTQNEGRWQSFPGIIVSDPHLLPDHAGEDSNKVSGWPIISGFPNSELYNYSAFNPVEKAKQSETVPSYKLFGVELINQSSSSTPMENTTTQLSTITTSHSFLHHMHMIGLSMRKMVIMMTMMMVTLGDDVTLTATMMIRSVNLRKLKKKMKRILRKMDVAVTLLMMMMENNDKNLAGTKRKMLVKLVIVKTSKKLKKACAFGLSNSNQCYIMELNFPSCVTKNPSLKDLCTVLVVANSVLQTRNYIRLVDLLKSLVGDSQEGQSTQRPPLFDGTNYQYWKNRMSVNMRAHDYEMWMVTIKGPFTTIEKDKNGNEVEKDSENWTQEYIRKVQANFKAINTIHYALNATEYNRISTCETAKQIWDKLQDTHEGTSQERELKNDEDEEKKVAEQKGLLVHKVSALEEETEQVKMKAQKGTKRKRRLKLLPLLLSEKVVTLNEKQMPTYVSW